MHRYHSVRENSKDGPRYRCSSVLNTPQRLPTEVFTYSHEEDKSTVKDIYRGANKSQEEVASQSEEGMQRVDISPIGSGRTGTTFDRAELVRKYPTELGNDENGTMQRTESM